LPTRRAAGVSSQPEQRRYAIHGPCAAHTSVVTNTQSIRHGFPSILVFLLQPVVPRYTHTRYFQTQGRPAETVESELSSNFYIKYCMKKILSEFLAAG
jgi:hypothetical protein